MLTPKFHEEAARRFFDADVCVEEVIWVAGQAGHQNDAFEDFCEEYPELVLELLGVDTDEDSTAEDVAAELASPGGKQGFLVHLSAPIPNDFYENGHSCGGARRLKWVYTPDFSDVVAQAEAFAQETIDQAKERFDEAMRRAKAGG